MTVLWEHSTRVTVSMVASKISGLPRVLSAYMSPSASLGDTVNEEFAFFVRRSGHATSSKPRRHVALRDFLS